jgi:hypothetical protein
MAAPRRRSGLRLRVEDLEGRALLSLTAINFAATVTSTPVAIHGEVYFAGYDATHGYQVW